MSRTETARAAHDLTFTLLACTACSGQLKQRDVSYTHRSLDYLWRPANNASRRMCFFLCSSRRNLSTSSSNNATTTPVLKEPLSVRQCPLLALVTRQDARKEAVSSN